MMFRHTGALLSTITVLFLLFVTSHCQSNSRSYDTNDWIPVSRPCPTCFQNTENQQESTQKKPTGRVLNLPAADQKRFFPDEPSNVNPQVYRAPGKQYNSAETDQQVQPNRQQQHQAQYQQAPKLQEVTTYVPGGQHILLPPQLQNIIAQGQPLLSPQRINSQLLHDVPYPQQPTNEEFRGNISQFNPRGIENLNLYNQRVIKPNQQLQAQQNIQQSNKQVGKQNINNGPEEVQLLYVPLENLRPRVQKIRGPQISFPTEQPYQAVQAFNQPPSQQYEPPLPHKQAQLDNIQQDFVQQALQAQKLQEQLQQNIQQIPQQNYRRPYVQQAPSAAPPTSPKKRKPHQPPLAVYMGIEGHQDIKVTDVLSLLKDAKTISVQDNVGPESPQVFVGPSHLEPPEGFVKFDLPYLSSIEGNRVERKVDQLPFFVAPLSYKAPPGYSKIPFPAPHVGSVVVNHMRELEQEARAENANNNLPDYNLSTTERNIPQKNSELSTARTKTRQRLPSRVSYPSSSIPPPPDAADIPYQSLPKEPVPLQSHSMADSQISSNPYGPTQFVKSTTAAYNLDDNPIPEQLFSTYGRFPTPTPYKSKDGPANNQPHFIQSVKQLPLSTVPPTISPSQSGIITSDKYTVLEQFPIPGKASIGQFPQENIPQRGRQQQQQLAGHQTQEFINNYTNKPSSSVLLSNNNEPQNLFPVKEQYVEQYQTAIPQTQPVIGQQYATNQNNLNKQLFLEQYNQQAEQPQNIPNQHSVTQQNIQPIQHHQPLQQEQTNTENPAHYVKPPTRQPGQQQFTPDIYFQDQYEVQRPNDRPVQHDRPSQETYKEVNIDYSIPQTPVQQLKTYPTRSRGRQHFTPLPEYKEEYDKPTESFIRNQQSAVRPSTPDYNVQISTQQPPRNRDKLQYVPDTYYHDDITQQPEEEQGFILPVQLPAISPQLPGLVNSLEDQAIRPLLAPLLIPPSEQTPATDSTPEYYSTHPPTTTTTTTTTTTAAPIIETTTQLKKLRSRQRGTRPTFSVEYANTTPSSRRPSSYRGRRPYTGRPRQEYNRPAQYLEEVTPTTTILHQEVSTDAPVRSNMYSSRNRFALQRDRTYASSTTEVPKRTVSNGRQRFKTRGRPTKTEEDYNSYASRTTTDEVPIFQQPALESGFQASLAVPQNNAYLPDTHSHTTNEDIEQILIHRPQQDQSVTYAANNKQLIQENAPIHINPEEFIAREHIISTTKPVTQDHQTSVPISAPESNIVSDVIHVDPALITHPGSDQVKYSHNIQNNPQLVQYTASEEINYNTRAPQSSNTETKINTHHATYVPENEPEFRFITTTETPRVRTRTRTRQRTRGYSSSNTPRYQSQQPTTTTTIKTTEASEENDEAEFYGFFRQPSFVKPVPVEYKQSTDLRSPGRTAPSVAYLSREQDDQPVYVNTAITPSQPSSNAYMPIEYADESSIDANIQAQHISSSSTFPSTTTITVEETTIDVKPVTRRPTSNFIRTRRPTTPAKPRTEVSTRAPEKYYTVRPVKRPDSQTLKVTRIRGRIRKPTKPTTTPAPVDTEAPYLNNQQGIHSSKQTDLPGNNQEHNGPVRQRQRTYNRGRSHFQITPNDKHLAIGEPESPNYPSSFLQAHGLPTPKSAALFGLTQTPTEEPLLSSQETVTSRPSFQLTIEPDDADIEYVDQLPYSSINKPTLSSKDLDDGAESQFSANIIQKPSNFNFISNNEKNISKLNETLKDNVETEINNNENTPVTEIQLQLTTTAPDESISRDDATTELPTTTSEGETEKPKSRRRGYWRLIKQRPISDFLESAESQNIGTIYSNNVFEDEKPERTYKIIQRMKTTKDSNKDETTDLPEIITALTNNQAEVNSAPILKLSKPEDEMLVPLYEMFGLDYEKNNDNKNKEHQGNFETTTTQLSTVFDEYSERFETTTSEFNATLVTEPPNSAEDETLVYSDQAEQSKAEWETTDETWKMRIIGTSTTTEVSHETEICYRGRCVKSATSENSSEV